MRVTPAIAAGRHFQPGVSETAIRAAAECSRIEYNYDDKRVLVSLPLGPEAQLYL